jgi:RimJ/RimL family protein N-acetyltransferase
LLSSAVEMKLNQSIAVEGDKIALVPYREEHVDRYHEWMQQKELQGEPESARLTRSELTASEPLTLDEERAMQRSWSEDDDSFDGRVVTYYPELTFIITDHAKGHFTDAQCPPPSRRALTRSAMVGDINIFLSRDEDDASLVVGELNLMIAEPSARRRGCAMQALTLAMAYAAQNVALDVFEARIGEANEPSRRLFEKAGFAAVRSCAAFAEVTMRRRVADEDKTLRLNTRPFG